MTAWLAIVLFDLGYEVGRAPCFDTLKVFTSKKASAHELAQAAAAKKINLRVLDAETLAISLDETTTRADLEALVTVFAPDLDRRGLDRLTGITARLGWPESLRRTTPFLTHPVFNRHHTETEMLRYIRRLESRDLSLCTSMIPLGSCTMKLNATAEMLPVSWPTVGKLHPFAADGPVARVSDALPSARGMAGRDHRHGGRLAAAECGFAGRVRPVSWPSAATTVRAGNRTGASA